MRVPIDVEEVFRSVFTIEDDEAVKFIDIKKRPEAYSQLEFNKRAHLKLRSDYKVPKALKSLIINKDDVMEIQSFELAKALIQDFFFKFGDNDATDIANKIRELSEVTGNLLDSFDIGFNSIDIRKEEHKLRDLYKDKSGQVSKDVEGWLTDNVSNIAIQVPDFLENVFTSLWGDDVKHSVINNSSRTENGHLKKWALSASVYVKTLDGMPTALQPFFKDGGRLLTTLHLH